MIIPIGVIRAKKIAPRITLVLIHPNALPRTIHIR
jgi:hypothetical protein